MDVQELATAVAQGDRRALARAITLVESAKPDHRAAAQALMAALPARPEALRLGLTGTPGVGKSSFIESFGLMLTGQGHKVAVLAVDPSSVRTGGSILGDKTRMERLSRDPLAYIRPSPSRTELGGVARRTREAVTLCEAAGFDIILIETVGVGQSETMVGQLCDIFLLLLAPAGGDELQGVKRGIMELADILLVNKADGALLPEATRTLADYTGALRLLRHRPQDPEGYPAALTVSALQPLGLPEVWAAVQHLAAFRRAHGHWSQTRAAQARAWFHEEVRQGLLAALSREPAKGLLQTLGQQVAAGLQTPEAAAADLLGQLGR